MTLATGLLLCAVMVLWLVVCDDTREEMRAMADDRPAPKPIAGDQHLPGLEPTFEKLFPQRRSHWQDQDANERSRSVQYVVQGPGQARAARGEGETTTGSPPPQLAKGD